jgi:16S rRNA (uracil1498-N3)-methyltransferase
MITLLSAPGTLVAGADLALEDGETHHLNVRRAVAGESIRLLDGQGTVAIGTIRLEGKRSRVIVESVRVMERSPAVTLAVGAGERDRFALLVEKAAELGATEIVPLETERTAGVSSRVRATTAGRLRERAREAIKQCGNAWAPVVHEPVSLREFVERSVSDVAWVGDPAGEVVPATLGSEAATVAIGPEGGFTDTERELFRRAGYVPIALGPHILRFETAALAALAGISAARRRGAHG